MSLNKSFKIIGSIGVCFLAGGIGSYVTTPQINSWYASLNKPVFNPPNAVFGPVWTTLYIFMGISLYLVWISAVKKEEKQRGIFFFFIQLTLNTLWSILFFALQIPVFAFIEIIVLWIMICLTIFSFRKISSYAAWLLVPYLLWVSFASILNLFIVILN